MTNIDRQTTLTPAAAAQRLGVEVYTVRRWSDWHAPHLSPGASPGPGALRRLTRRDIEVLLLVRDMRAQGLHTETINEQLAGLTFAVVDTDEHPADSEELASVASPDSLQSTQALIMESLQRRFDTLEAARQEDRRERLDRLTMLGIGICIGLLFAVGMIVLAWLYGG